MGSGKGGTGRVACPVPRLIDSTSVSLEGQPDQRHVEAAGAIRSAGVAASHRTGANPRRRSTLNTAAAEAPAAYGSTPASPAVSGSRVPPEHLFAYSDRRVGVIRKQAIDAELVVKRKLGRLIAASVQVLRAVRIAYAEVRCKEVVLGTEGERVQEQPDAMGVAHQSRRPPKRVAGGVARHDAALVRADSIRVGSDLAQAPRRDQVVVRPRVAAGDKVSRRAGDVDQLNQRERCLPPQPLQVSDLEGLDEYLRPPPVKAITAQRAEQRPIKREAERLKNVGCLVSG